MWCDYQIFLFFKGGVGGGGGGVAAKKYQLKERATPWGGAPKKPF